MVHGILAAHVPPADAVDLIQDVFLRAMGQLEGLREPGAVGGLPRDNSPQCCL